MSRRVAITGLGLVCSQGQDPQAVFDQWLNGQSGIALHDVGEAPFSAQAPMARCDGFDAAAALGRSRLTTMDRVSQLSAVAAQNAWQDAGLSDASEALRQRCGTYWGTGGGGTHTVDKSYRDLFVKQRPRISPLSVVLGMHNAAASHIALGLGLGADCLTYSVACASSAMAIGEAMRRIQHGGMDIAVAGGAEASMPFGSLKAWESLQVMAQVGDDASRSCRPFDAARTGLVLGEGAAAFVLEAWDHAVARGAHIHAELVGYGSSCDHSHLTAPHAGGQLRALQEALAHAGLQPSQIGYVNAHGTATAEGDPTEVSALRSLFGDHAAKVMVSATKSLHGHLLGAAGAIEALVTTLALQHQAIPPTGGLTQVDPACEGLDHVKQHARAGVDVAFAVSNSFAFGGSNAVLVLRRVPH